MKQVFGYGMRLRPFGMGCQPMNGLIEAVDSYENEKYWNILIYDRELTDDELKDYDLDRLEQKEIDASWPRLGM